MHRTNLELSLHIDAIHCHRDGRVVVRTCKLGALTGCADLLAQPDFSPIQAAPNNENALAAKPRRRAIRRVITDDSDAADLQSAAHRAADVDRFAGLGPEWFWEDTFQIPSKVCWLQQNAVSVAAKRQDTAWSVAQLAE